jgi:hypothetical protein
MASRNRERDPFTGMADPGLAGKQCRAGVIGLLLLTSIVTLSGCQISWPFERPASLLDNAQFMGAWETYLHCRSSTEPGAIRADLQRLNHVANLVTIQNQASVFLPVAIRSLIAAPPSRLAVDPEAMVVACAVHGGHVAQSAGQPELSVELFTAVVAERRGAAMLSTPSRMGENSAAWRRGVSFENR